MNIFMYMFVIMITKEKEAINLRGTGERDGCCKKEEVEGESNKLYFTLKH